MYKNSHNCDIFIEFKYIFSYTILSISLILLYQWRYIMSEDVSLLTQENIADEIKSLVEKWKDSEGNLIMICHGIQQRLSISE